MKQPIITILTDFGIKDPYVGIMKGVIADICPEANTIDLTHAVQPGNIKQAAFLLKNSIDYFPDNTVFLIVVDPGVGSKRNPIAAKIGNKYFVAPDNGVLSYIFNDKLEVVVTDKPEFHLDNISATFHGRDIFSPVSAHLAAKLNKSRKLNLSDFGKPFDEENPFKIEEPLRTFDKSGNLHGEILHIDIFGNLISSIRTDDIDKFDKNKMKINIGKIKLKGLKNTFSDVKSGEPVAYIGSSGCLELGIRDGSFSEKYKIAISEKIKIK